MRDRAGPPLWAGWFLDEEILADAFEPAWHEAFAVYVSRSGSRGSTRRFLSRMVLQMRTVLLVMECARLQALRSGPVRRRKIGTMEQLASDLRFGWRALVKRPVFAGVAVVTLALGIGANSAIFSVVNGVILKPLPFEEPERLVTVDVQSSEGYYISLSLPNLRDWRERNRSFEGLGAEAAWSMVRQAQDGSDVVEARIVLGEFFELLGVGARLGRWFTAAESERFAAPVAVLTDGYWRRVYAADPGVIGTTITLDGRPHTIIGVMPAGFAYPSAEAELYVPMGSMSSLPWDTRTSSFGARALARLAPGVTVEAAGADLDRITSEIDAEEGRPGVRPTVRTLTDFYTGDARGPYLVLMGAVVFVLLIAGANVANLLLARGEDRRAEVAVRVALGAGRGAIVRQVLVESMIVAGLGTILGLAVAWSGVGLIRANMPLPPIVDAQVAMDGSVLLFTAILGLFGGLAFGLIPAVRLSAATPTAELRDGGRGTGSVARHRIRSALVIVEIMLALVLLVGSGLMLGSLSRLHGADVGFSSENVVAARVPLPGADYPDRERWFGFYEALMDRLSSEPGVTSAAAMLLVPLSDRSWELRVQPEGEVFGRDEGESVLYNIVSPSYFETLSIPLLGGRNFGPGDRNDAPPVAIIDETMAAMMWPGEDPIGKRIVFEEEAASTRESPLPVYRTVVGVVPNVRHYDVRSASRIQVYVPLRQSLRTWGTSLNVAVRTTADASAIGPVLRDAVRGIDRNVPLYDVATLDSYVAGNMSNDTAMGSLLTVFGALALGLAAIGVFGVMSLLVATRSREIGVRLAIGARPPQVLAMVLGRTVALAIAGVALGLVAAVGLSRLLVAFLFEINPLDPVVYAMASAFLVSVAMSAALVPAIRASRIDPIRTLREDN